MRRQTVLPVVAGLYLLAIAVCAFLVVEPAPVWGAFLTWLVAGALVAAAVRPARWWVVLGFLWLGAAWVEAGQAVWLERPASVVDVAVGCLATAIGVAAVTALRVARRRQLDRVAALSGAEMPAAPPPR